jgi:hypothetical protein
MPTRSLKLTAVGIAIYWRSVQEIATSQADVGLEFLKRIRVRPSTGSQDLVEAVNERFDLRFGEALAIGIQLGEQLRESLPEGW